MKTRLNFRLCPLNAALTIAGLLMAPGSGFAQSTDWNSGAGGAWSSNTNWTSNAPTAADTARLTNNGDQATLTGAGTAQALEVLDSGEVDVTAGGSLVVTGIIKLGTTAGVGAARLTIEGGGTVSATNLFAGDAAARQGIVTLTGAGSSLTLAPIGLGQADRFEIGGNGAGQLQISADANVTVNGTRTLHVGDTAVGTLIIGNVVGRAGTLTADSVILGNAGSSVLFAHTGTTTFVPAVSGNGSLFKLGTGTTILAGANSYTGGTTVNAGTLQGDTTSLQGNITNNAIVSFDQAINGTYTGAITGTGSLTKAGTGTTILTGANSYTGATTVNGGILQGNTTSLRGNIANNAIVSFDQAINGTYTGVITGTGSLTKAGTGTTILTGANTYTGGTTVNAGTLQGDTTSLRGNIANNAAVNFDQAAAGTYAGVMSGTGTFTKLGAGNLSITGGQTYTGATTVNAGTLSVNGSIAGSAVTVNNGATLGGNGTVGSTSIASGGVLAPGNSIGTLTVNGNLSFAAGSIYRVEVDAAGANDRINATGTATINGGTVDVQAGAGTYQARTQYTILNAAGGRTGNFAGVTSNLAFLTPTLGYDANNVFLTLARNDISFSAVAVTPNQIATATALQNAEAGASGDMSTVTNAVAGLSAAQARAAYDSASGAGLVALRNAGGSFAAGFGSQLQARMGAVGGASTQVGAFAGGPILLAANDHVSDLMAPVSDSPQKFSLGGGTSSSSSSASSEGRGFWLRSSGSQQSTGSDGNAAASKLRNGALSAGFDAEVGEGLVIGAALNSGTSRLSFDNNDAGKSRGSALAVYGSYASGPWAFKGSASAAWNRNHMDRSVVVGAIQRTATADFDSNTLSAYGEATYSIPMNGWTLQPLAALSLSRSKTDGFTETGAGALNLQVAGQTATSTKSLLGAKASFEAGSVRLEPRVIWAHEFGDLNTPMTAQFQGAATASPFQVSGAALKRDTLILGLGASGSISKGMDLFADVQAEHNSRQNNLAVLVGLRARW